MKNEWENLYKVNVANVTMNFMKKYNNETNNETRIKMKEDFERMMKRNDLEVKYGL